MVEYKFRISGVHYAANPEAEAGMPDTEKMAGDWYLSRTTTALARADCKGGVCIGLADNYQFIVWQVVPDLLGIEVFCS